MDLLDVWPLFGLTLTSPRLTLRIVRDNDIPALLEAAYAGIHDPARMPFKVPWTDAEPEQMRRDFARHQWRQRISVQPNNWVLNFAVLYDGKPIGIQDLRAADFSVRKTVTSGSWLTQQHQGSGLGTEMRAAMLLFAFDHLGAEIAESSAASWNQASLGVSRHLGYEDNGTTRRTPRSGQLDEEQRLQLTSVDFTRPSWNVKVEGLAGALRDLI